jgi:hypothetical protein
MAPLCESDAIRSGFVLSTRAISASAARGSEVNLSSGRAPGAGGKPLCEGWHMSAVLPIIAWLLLIASSFGSGARIRAGRRVFYALQGRSVFPQAAMLCPILLLAGARFRKRTIGGADLSKYWTEIARGAPKPLKWLVKDVL